MLALKNGIQPLGGLPKGPTYFILADSRIPTLGTPCCPWKEGIPNFGHSKQSKYYISMSIWALLGLKKYRQHLGGLPKGTIPESQHWDQLAAPWKEGIPHFGHSKQSKSCITMSKWAMLALKNYIQPMGGLPKGTMYFILADRRITTLGSACCTLKRRHSTLWPLQTVQKLYHHVHMSSACSKKIYTAPGWPTQGYHLFYFSRS